MNEPVQLTPDVETRLQELLQLPAVQRAEVADRLLDSLYLSIRPDDRELRGEAERQDLRDRLEAQVQRVAKYAALNNCWPPDPSRIDLSWRAPRVRGTRITIFSLIDFLITGSGYAEVAAFFPRVLAEDVVAASDYIGRHLDQVVRDYQSILERHRKYQPPADLKATLAATRERVLALRERLRREAELTNHPEEVHAGDSV